MRLVFAAHYNARDINRGSGTPYFLTRELERQGHEILTIGPVAFEWPLETRALRKISHVLGRKYRSYQDVFAAERIGAAIAEELAGVAFDALVTNDFAIAGYTQTDRPVILYTDAMFPKDYRRNIHPWLAGLSPISVLFAKRIVRRALRRAAVCAFASDYAYQEALAFGADPGKLYCIPYGANLPDLPDADVTACRSFARIEEKGQIDLLFVGKDWDLKGGDVAAQTMRTLDQRGIRPVLHIVGAVAAGEGDAVRFHGVLDKGNPADWRQLDALYRSCDAFILPTVAEGYGVVFAEAAAYGLPSLAYETIGVETAVKQGQSGVLLARGSGPGDFAAVVESWYETPGAYEALSSGARAYFEEMVNWGTAASRLGTVVEELLRGGPYE